MNIDEIGTRLAEIGDEIDNEFDAAKTSKDRGEHLIRERDELKLELAKCRSAVGTFWIRGGFKFEDAWAGSTISYVHFNDTATDKAVTTISLHKNNRGWAISKSTDYDPWVFENTVIGSKQCTREEAEADLKRMQEIAQISFGTLV